jgi:hypothetical protein
MSLTFDRLWSQSCQCALTSQVPTSRSDSLGQGRLHPPHGPRHGAHGARYGAHGIRRRGTSAAGTHQSHHRDLPAGARLLASGATGSPAWFSHLLRAHTRPRPGAQAMWLPLERGTPPRAAALRPPHTCCCATFCYSYVLLCDIQLQLRAAVRHSATATCGCASFSYSYVLLCHIPASYSPAGQIWGDGPDGRGESGRRACAAAQAVRGFDSALGG